jgi:hypothetical protein
MPLLLLLCLLLLLLRLLLLLLRLLRQRLLRQRLLRQRLHQHSVMSPRGAFRRAHCPCKEKQKTNKKPEIFQWSHCV